MGKDSYDVMDLKALRCFWATAKHGSLTRAGIELGISEAAVSQRVKGLENYLGTKLYEARGGRVRLTTAGERTMQMAMELFDELDEFAQTISDAGAVGNVTISAEDAVLRYLLPDVVGRFREEFPLAHLRLLTRTATESVELVRVNEVDLGIISQHELPEAINFHAIRTFPAYLLLPRGHPLIRGGKPEIKDLLNEETLDRYPFVVPVQSEDKRLAEVLKREGLPYNVAVEVGTIETVKHYVVQGHGMAVVSGICLTEADRDVLDTIEIPGEFGGATTYGVIWRRDKHMASALNGILAILGGTAAQA